jgi:hypothetical protein
LGQPGLHGKSLSQKRKKKGKRWRMRRNRKKEEEEEEDDLGSSWKNWIFSGPKTEWYLPTFRGCLED